MAKKKARRAAAQRMGAAASEAKGNLAKALGEKPPGRPPGSTNKEYQDAIAIPAACPKCACTNLLVVPGSAKVTHRFNGVILGRIYRRFSVIKKRCRDCGQRVNVREYELEPEK